MCDDRLVLYKRMSGTWVVRIGRIRCQDLLPANPTHASAWKAAWSPEMVRATCSNGPPTQPNGETMYSPSSFSFNLYPHSVSNQKRNRIQNNHGTNGKLTVNNKLHGNLTSTLPGQTEPHYQHLLWPRCSRLKHHHDMARPSHVDVLA